ILDAAEREHKTQWPSMLNSLLFAYNSSARTEIGLSPAQLLFGRTPRIPYELLTNLEDHAGHRPVDEWIDHQSRYLGQAWALVQQVRDLDLKELHRLNSNLDRRRQPIVFKVGDLVLMRNPRTLNYKTKHLTNELPYLDSVWQVTRVNSPISYRICFYDTHKQAPTGVERAVHVQLLKPFHAPTDVAQSPAPAVNVPPVAPAAPAIPTAPMRPTNALILPQPRTRIVLPTQEELRHLEEEEEAA